MILNQYQALRKLLSQRTPEQPSTRLDEHVKKAARIELERAEKSESWLTWLLTPASFAGNVTASVMVTMLVFLGMAKMVAVSEPDVILSEPVLLASSPQENTLTALAPLSSNSTAGSSMERPAYEVYTPDQVLLEISLPSVPDLIRSMEFVADSDRTTATIELISALAEINSMIRIGELEFARSRYNELRQRCYACQLPNSLEALALAKLDSPGQG